MASSTPVFDPRCIPVVAVDHHLPAVEPQRLQPHALKSRFLLQQGFVPEIAGEARFSERPLTAAAVLVPIVMRQQPVVLLTERTAHLSSHSGQIAFPGGKVDPQDKDTAATALREASEEVGLDIALAEVIGMLPTYTTGSAYAVTPVIALIQPQVHWDINANEVASAFEVPLEFLMNPANHRHHEVEWSGATRRWLSMPYQDAQVERFIWGATAGMLRNFYRFLMV